MSASVASKNLFDALGNDVEDPDAPPPKPPREVVKSVTTSKKKEEKIAPSAQTFEGGYAPRNNTRGGRYSGNERAFRDREAGRQNNVVKNVEDGGVAPRGGYRGRGRGGRRDYDRHSATGRTDTERRLNQGWGGGSGNGEWNDEIAGQELAQKDAAGANPADPNAIPPTDAPTGEGEVEEVPEPEEEKVKTLDEYQAELEARRAELGPPPEVRRPNEGTQGSKWVGKEIQRKAEEEDAYFVGESKDRSRNRERKTKNILDIDQRFVDQKDRRVNSGPRGGRGGRGRGGGGGGGGSGGSGGVGVGGGQRGGQKNDGINPNDFPALGA